MINKKLKAAVIGLGQVGSRFDEEPRAEIWSHVGAYLQCNNKYNLVAGVDIDETNLNIFSQRCPGVNTYRDALKMVVSEDPDVISICTPPLGRYDLIKNILKEHSPKAIICEKPLELERYYRNELVSICENNNVKLWVNYNRRYYKVYQKVHSLIQKGIIGSLRSVLILAPNRVWSVGSHTVNLMYYLSGEFPVESNFIRNPSLNEGNELAGDFSFYFKSGVTGHIVTTGFKKNLMFQVIVVGDKGKVEVNEQTMKIKIDLFKKSDKYVDYNELYEDIELDFRKEKKSSFVSIVDEVYEVVSTGRTNEISSSGYVASLTESEIDLVVNQK